MKVTFAALARIIVIDRFTNGMSLFQVVERIEAEKFPLLLPEAAFVAVLNREEGDPQQWDTELILHCGDAVVGKSDLHVDFENGLANRQVVNFQGLPVMTAADLLFQFALPSGQISELRIPVAKIRPAAAEPIPARTTTNS